MGLKNKKILFLGCGKMGSAIIKNLFQSSFEIKSFLVLDPNIDNQIPDLKFISSYQQIPREYKADIVFFAFKPQGADEIIKNITARSPFHKDTIFVSILAGKKIAFFENLLGEDKKILRLMPNLPITIGGGICAYSCGPNLKEREVRDLLNGLGENIEVKEELMDAVTAISGSGPAYLFLFAKIMIESAQKLGLSEEQSNRLVKHTILGSTKMVLSEEDNLSQLIDNVTSKGGTTQAALEVLEEGDLEGILFDGIEAAFNRSKEL